MHQLDSLHPIIEKIINNIEKLMVGKKKRNDFSFDSSLS